MRITPNTRPFTQLSPPHLPDPAQRAMERALASGQWAYGPRAATLEARVAALLEVPSEWVVATSSCTAALAAAGRLVDDGPVAACPLTWPSTYGWADGVEGVEWVDCDEAGWPVAPVTVGVDLWGRKFRTRAREIPPIIDAAHRFADPEHGEMLRGGHVKAVCYSFGPQKEVSSFHGGALVSPEAPSLRSYLNCGMGPEGFEGPGIKGLISDISAAMLCNKLSRWKATQQRRTTTLRRYTRHLGGQVLTREGEASGHLCVIDCTTPTVKKMVARALSRKPKIHHSTHHLLSPAQREACPRAAMLYDRVLSIPCHLEMTKYDVDRVCTRVLTA